MFDVFAQSALFNLAYLLLALLIGWIILLWLDRRLARGEGSFADHFRTMQASPVGLAIYLGLRFLGVCWLVSAFVRG
jgi:hypothetical protein